MLSGFEEFFFPPLCVCVFCCVWGGVLFVCCVCVCVCVCVVGGPKLPVRGNPAAQESNCQGFTHTHTHSTQPTRSLTHVTHTQTHTLAHKTHTPHNACPWHSSSDI